MDLRRRVAALDRYQRRHPWLGFPVAVWQKHLDDEGGRLAAALAYYGIYSIFPLLLVFVSVLGFALRGHPKLERSIIDSALGQFPVLGHQLQTHSLQGSSIGLAVGLAASLWAGMRVFVAGESVMNQLWGIPPVARPTFVRARGRALLLLLVVGEASWRRPASRASARSEPVWRSPGSSEQSLSPPASTSGSSGLPSGC